jgi:radical SAM protein with 4Fe4S-binding SPASM domain
MRNIDRIRRADEEYYRDHVYFVATLTPPYDLAQIDRFFGNGHRANNTLSANFMETYDTEFFRKYTRGMENLADESLARIKQDYVVARSEGRDPSKLAVALIDQGMIRLHRRGDGELGEAMPLNGCCVPGVRRIFVTAEGEFYPCEKVESKAFMIGTVESGVDRKLVECLMDRYAGESLSDCADCWALRLCSLCYTSAKHGDTFDIERKRQRCTRQRNTWDGMLQMYTTILEQNPKAFDFVKDLYIE